jgi:group I intron endonuclease
MIGIYKITNEITGQFYIGQSTDISRRWIEHKTPKASGNDYLHNDMKKYGLSNFKFEVIEECEKEKLLERESYYIHTLNPYYNVIGKPMADEVKANVSAGMKKTWDSFSDEHKQRIIKNLTGHKKGYVMSAETRQKISKKVSEIQKQKVRCIETCEIYPSITDFEKSVGACAGTCNAFWKEKIKSVKGYHVEKV